MEGICRGCGQIQEVNAKTQEEADAKATLSCDCTEGAYVRRKLQLGQNMCLLTGKDAEKQGFKALDDEIVCKLLNIADLVLTNKIQQVKVSVDNTNITIKIDGKGNVKVSRTEKKNISAEI